MCVAAVVVVVVVPRLGLCKREREREMCEAHSPETKRGCEMGVRERERE